MMKDKFQQLKKKIQNMFTFKARKGSTPWGLALLLSALGGPVGTGVAVAIFGPGVLKDVATGIQASALSIFESIAKVVLLILGGLIKIAIGLLIGVSQYNGFINESAIVEAWTIIRDISNMFFIFMFLVMAVGTILKNEKYSWQKMLIPLALIAIFVNFSRTICGVIIDFSQVVMLTFVNAFKEVGGGNLLKLLGLDQFLSWDILVKNQEVQMQGVGSLNVMQVLGLYWLGVAVAFVALIVLFIAIVILFIRIIVLWFLIILSPLAFICYVVPGLQKYAKMWQDKFFYQAIVGPVMAFFIWVSFLVVEKSTAIVSTPEAAQIIDSANQRSGVTGSIPVLGQLGFYVGYILGIGLLISSLVAAKQLGVAGAGMAGQGVSFIQKTGTGIAKGVGKIAAAPAKVGARAAGGFAYRKVLESPLKVFTPDFWKGYRQRGERLRNYAKLRAGGSGEQLAEFIGERGKRRAISPREDLVKMGVLNQIESEQEKEIGQGGESKEKRAELAAREYFKGGEVGRNGRMAAIAAGAGQGNFDDIQEYFLKNGYINDKEGDANHWKNWGFKSWEEAKKRNDPSVYRKFALHYLGLSQEFNPEYWQDQIMEERKAETNGKTMEELETGNESEVKLASDIKNQARNKAKDKANNASAKEQEGLRTMFIIGQRSRRVGHWDQVMGGLNTDTGKYYVYDEDEAIDEASGEAQKMGMQKFLSEVAPHTMVGAYNEDATADKITSPEYQSGFHRKFLNKVMKREMVAEFRRMQARVATQVLGIGKKGDKGVILDEKTGMAVDENAARIYQQLRSVNPEIIDAFWNAHFRGDAKLSTPAYGALGFKPEPTEAQKVEEDVKERTTTGKEISVEHQKVEVKKKETEETIETLKQRKETLEKQSPALPENREERTRQLDNINKQLKEAEETLKNLGQKGEKLEIDLAANMAGELQARVSHVQNLIGTDASKITDKSLTELQDLIKELQDKLNAGNLSEMFKLRKADLDDAFKNLNSELKKQQGNFTSGDPDIKKTFNFAQMFDFCNLLADRLSKKLPIKGIETGSAKKK